MGESMPHTAAPHHIPTRVSTGRVFLVSEILKELRSQKLQSQEEMAFACSDQKIRVSIASIKRAETGKPVIYRVARELARYFDVPVQTLIRPAEKIGQTVSEKPN